MAWATLIMIAAPLAQFVLGMAANLFVTIPAHHPGASPKNYLAGPGHSVGRAITSGLLPLAAHLILGILLIVAGFVLIALAASSGHRGVLIASICADPRSARGRQARAGACAARPARAIRGRRPGWPRDAPPAARSPPQRQPPVR